MTMTMRVLWIFEMLEGGNRILHHDEEWGGPLHAWSEHGEACSY